MKFLKLIEKSEKDLSKYINYSNIDLIQETLQECLKSYINNLNSLGNYYIIKELKR